MPASCGESCGQCSFKKFPIVEIGLCVLSMENFKNKNYTHAKASFHPLPNETQYAPILYPGCFSCDGQPGTHCNNCHCIKSCHPVNFFWAYIYLQDQHFSPALWDYGLLYSLMFYNNGHHTNRCTTPKHCQPYHINHIH